MTKKNTIRYQAFVPGEVTDKTVLAAVTAVSKAVALIGMPVTRVLLRQAELGGGPVGATEMEAHEFLQDKSFPADLGMNYYIDFPHEFLAEQNVGQILELARRATTPSGWLVNVFAASYKNPAFNGGPGTMSLMGKSPFEALLSANPDITAALDAKIRPFMQAALDADDSGN